MSTMEGANADNAGAFVGPVCSGFPRNVVRLGGALGTRYARVARLDPRLSTRHSARGSAGDLIRNPVLHHFKQIIQSNKTKKWNHSQTLIYQHNSWGCLRLKRTLHMIKFS
jgi:hypothetical protein